MKKLPVLKELAFFGTILLVVFAYSFTSPNDHSSKNSIKNISADDYPSVKIGTQIWMTENLDIDHFRNGDPIPEVTTQKEWIESAWPFGKKPAWCFYNFNPVNGEKYGRLYNKYAVNDARGLAPEGWHIPSDKEWDILIKFLGGDKVAGKKMKNKSGFSGLPSGACDWQGFSFDMGEMGYWWSFSIENCHPISTYFEDGEIYFDNHKGSGFSIRCVKD